MERQVFSHVREPCTVFFVESAGKVWDVLSVFQQTAVTFTWLLYMLWLLHLMTVLNDITPIVQRDSLQSPVYFRILQWNDEFHLSSWRGFSFKFSVSRVLVCHIYVDWLVMSFQWMKKFLLSFCCTCLISGIFKNLQDFFQSCISSSLSALLTRLCLFHTFSGPSLWPYWSMMGIQ